MGRSAPLPALLICACMLIPTRAQFGGLIGKVIQAAANSEEAKQVKKNTTESVSKGFSNGFRTANQQAVVQTSEYGMEVEMPQRAKVGERYMFPIRLTNFLVDPIELTVLFSVPNNTVLDTAKTYKGFKLGAAADAREKGAMGGGSRQSDEDAYATKLKLGTDDEKRSKTLEVYATTTEPGDLMWNVRIMQTKDITPGFLPKLITIEPVAPLSHAAAAAAQEEGEAEEEEKETEKKSANTHTETSQATDSSSDADSQTTTAAAADAESSPSAHKKSASSSSSTSSKPRSSSHHHSKTKSSSSGSSLKTTTRGGSKRSSSSM